MNKKAIIHLSDLHVSIHETLKGVAIDCNSILTTDKQNQSVNNFIKEFCKTINEKFNGFELILVISGDITDKSIIEEYKTAEYILQQIISKLSISLNNVLLVPGDHDVNRDDCRKAHENGKRTEVKKKSYEYFDEKFEKFKIFYDTFYQGNNIFNSQKSVVNLINLNNEKLLLIGLNSNFKIDYDGGNGFFSINQLEHELDEINETYPDHSKIVVFHHNIFASYENKMKGQWDDEHNNRLAVFRVFEKYPVNCLFYGNEHTRSSATSISHRVAYSDSGTFANSKKNPIPSFKVYEVLFDDKTLKLKNNLFLLLEGGLSDLEFKFGKWTLQLQSELDAELDEISIRIPEEATVKEDLSLEKTFSESKLIVEVKKTVPENYLAFSNDNEDHIKLLKIIKDKNLFHSGHFHWSETSRAHNWIDISRILNNRNNLLDAKKIILNIISKNKLEFDFIIGLGIEGNILATRTSVIHNKPYTFLPYSYRYDDHSKFEKKLNFQNDGIFNTILIITDVVHDGRTIRKLLHKRRDDETYKFFEKVKKIIVVSLFFTGELPLDKSQYHNLLNRSEGNEFDSVNDHVEDRIQFHFVSHIKVETCPYTKENYKTDCIIVKEGLSCIHKFYTEKLEL
jgi:3',5'-cyclic AMP phosphodiesterase CpdA